MLTSEQYKFLKKLLKKDKYCDDLHGNYDPVYMYLLEKKFIEYYNVFSPYDIDEKNPTLYCKITELGKVELLLCRQSWYHFWIPTVISIIALIASILPIACSYVQTVLYQASP